MTVAVQDDLERNYAAALGLVEALEAEWEAMGFPLLAHDGGATGRSTVEHPIVKMLQVARRDVDRFAKGVQARHRGPETKAVIQASLAKSPSSARLKAVKSA